MNNTKLIGITTVLLTSSWALAQDPRFTKQPTNATVSLGATAQFVVFANTASPPLTYQWYFKDAPLDPAANPSAATRTLSLTDIQLAQAGSYFVAVTNALGASANSDVAVLDVDPTFTKMITGPPVTDLGCSYGGSWRDYDGDGFDDLVVPRYRQGTSAIYRSNGDGTFTSQPYRSWGVLARPSHWGDLDSDGHLDLVAWQTVVDPFYVYFNNGDGTFSQGEIQVPRKDALGLLGLVDYDQDGLLDIFEAGSAGTTNRFYRNLGDRTFVWMKSEDVGSVSSSESNGGGSCVDYDDDGWIDVYSRGGLDRNLGNGRFAKGANYVRGSLNGDWGDYDNDGRVDLCVQSHTPIVWRNRGDGEFEEVSSGETPAARYNNSATWVDYDNDGFLDLFRTWVDPLTRYTLTHNNGDGTFSQVTTGSIVTDTPSNASGTYAGFWFDFNNDGFMDLYIINGDDPGAINTKNFLYRNNGNANAWLKVKLIGTASSRDAVGAKVRVQARFAGQLRWLRRDIALGDLWSGWNRPYAHFGLGDATIVDLVRVEWPSGLVNEFTNVSVKQTLTVTEHQEGVKTAPSLTATSLAIGAVQLTLTGDKNLLYVLEGSTDLVKWMKLGVRTNLTGTVEFTDTFAAKYPQRFYRGIAR